METTDQFVELFAVFAYLGIIAGVTLLLLPKPMSGSAITRFVALVAKRGRRTDLGGKGFGSFINRRDGYKPIIGKQRLDWAITLSEWDDARSGEKTPDTVKPLLSGTALLDNTEWNLETRGLSVYDNQFDGDSFVFILWLKTHCDDWRAIDLHVPVDDEDMYQVGLGLKGNRLEFQLELMTDEFGFVVPRRPLGSFIHDLAVAT